MIMHFLDVDGRYLCIKACGTTKEKLTLIPSRVTCKNCIRKLTRKKKRRYVKPEKVMFT